METAKMRTFKEYLAEWPYTERKDKVFNFEVERYKSLEDFKTFMKYLMSGTTVEDKYGNKFKIKTTSGMKEFKDSLLDNPLFFDAVRGQFSVKDNQIQKVINEL